MKTKRLIARSLLLLAFATFNPQLSTSCAQGSPTPMGARPNRKRMLWLAAAMSLLLGMATLASAAPLQFNGYYNGGQLVYDPNTDLTWYQAPYTNVTWYVAMDWAASLYIGGTNGWRLPSIAPATPEEIDANANNLDDGELAYLWYDELGNHFGAMTNSGPFDPTPFNPLPNNGFWTSAGPYYAHLSTFAVLFDLHGGIYGLAVIQGGGAFEAEIAVCAGNVGLNGPLGPHLTVTRSGNSVIISWPSPSTGWTLQQCSDLAAGNWTTSGYTISASNSTNSITLAAPAGNLFFRLKQ